MALQNRDEFAKKLRNIYVNLYGESVLDDCFVWEGFRKGYINEETLLKWLQFYTKSLQQIP